MYKFDSMHKKLKNCTPNVSELKPNTSLTGVKTRCFFPEDSFGNPFSVDQLVFGVYPLE